MKNQIHLLVCKVIPLLFVSVIAGMQFPSAAHADYLNLDGDCEWKFRLSPGVTTWFFDEESELLGPFLGLDIWRSDYPINFHVGVEGRHMYLGQEEAVFAQEYDDKTTQITFIRIPIAVEYIQPISQTVTLYVGAGPDIIRTANDISETAVGMHVGSRLHFAFNDSWGASVEAGYMWGEVDGQGDDVVLDNTYITPALTYTF